MTPPTDTLLRCHTCGREREVSFAHHLEHGWPECPDSRHGTMQIAEVAPGAIDQAIEHALIPIRNAVLAATALMDRAA